MHINVRDEPYVALAVTTEVSDADLVSQAQAAPDAFAPLYLRYRNAVMNYCYYRLRSREDAEDAASAIFIKALSHLSSFTERGDSFRTWLFRIAHNEIADRHRRHGRHPEQPLLPELRLVDAATLPEDAAIVADRHARVLALLDQLPPRERSVLELRAAELNTKEIALVLGMTEQNVRTAQSRAVARLRQLLGETRAPGREAHDA